MERHEMEELATVIAAAVGQQVSQVVQELTQTHGVTAGETVMTGARNIEDIGGTERLEKDQMSDSNAWFANVKRTYDEYQNISLEGARTGLESTKRNRSYVDNVLTDAQSHNVTLRQLSTQALQNAVETANLVSKQSVRHSDIAIDRQWNVDEQGYTVAEVLRDETFKDALAAEVARAFSESKKTEA
jgi:polyhydroxyalkanoate synthesis regulator phasin